MISAPQIDPVALRIGFLEFHWYGVMYVLAFASAWMLGRYRASQSHGAWKKGEFDDLLTFGMLGVILGGRLGYVLFYDFSYYFENLGSILKIWQGGMSFHGGLLGVLIGMYFFAKYTKRNFWQVVDFVAPLVPLGLFFGRIGNFINGELWGNVTTLPIGVVFPNAGPLPRHPSQLYEAFFEGILLFVFLWWYSSKPRPLGSISGFFALGYGLARFGVEFVRIPDAHLGYLAFGWLTMGQVLSIPLILVGIFLLWYSSKKGVVN